MASPTAKRYGFTFIELMVVMSIMAIFFAVAQANYRDFQRRRDLDGVVSEFTSQLVVAQQKALAGDRTGCGTGFDLAGYAVARLSSTTYSIGVSCGLASIPTSISLPAGYVFDTAWPTFIFTSVGGGLSVNSNVTMTIRQTSTGSTASVVVTPTGEIK